MFVFKERGKVRSTLRKPSRGKGEDQQQTQPTWFSFVNFFNSHDGYKIDQVMNEMGVNASESDIEILKQVCAAISIRAARLAAAGIAAIIKVC